MEKIILQTAGTMEWKTIGIFDNIESVNEWIKDNWNITFEEFKNEVLTEEGYEPTFEEWLDENELNIIYTNQLGL